MRLVPCRPLLLGAIVALALPAAATTAPEPTTLSGRVLDPVTGDGIGGAAVRLGNRRTTTTADGSFSVRLGKRRASHVATSVAAPGFREYCTWTATGGETLRDVFLFPAEEIYLPGIPGHHADTVSAELFEEHFHYVYRNEEQLGGRLTRWIAQPEIWIVDHVTEWREIPPEDRVTIVLENGAMITPSHDLLASERRTPRVVVRRLKRAIRDSLGPLTGGFLSGERIRRRRVRPGDHLARLPWEISPPGELVVYVHENPAGSTGIGLLEGQAIVGGALFMFDEVFLRPPERYSPRLLLHELGHVLGMHHFANGGEVPNPWPLGTPLCSVVSQRECELGYRLRAPTPVDLVTARLAYSRMPGNDGADVDPDPRDAARATRTAERRVVWFDGGPPWIDTW